MAKRSRNCSLALFVSLAASLLFIVYLARVGYDFKRETEAVRLDPVGLKRYASERATTPTDGPLLMFFGDSRAVMWPAPDGLSKYRVVNRGIGYQTTAQILLRMDDDVSRLRPAVVVFEGGINDLKAIVDFPERRSEIVADCEANIARIVERCVQGGATVVLVTVFGVGDVPLWRRPFWSSDVAVAVREVNAFLSKLVGPHVVLFDANSIITDGRGGIWRAYQFDYLHLSATGYAAMNSALSPILSGLVL